MRSNPLPAAPFVTSLGWRNLRADTLRSGLRTRVAVAIALMLSLSAMARADIVIVAQSGGMVPGDNAQFSDVLIPGQQVFGVPRIDAGGRIGFPADLMGAGITPANDNGLYVFRIEDGAPVGSEIVRRGDAAPGSSGASFNLGLTPTLGLGQSLAIQPTLSSGSLGIYLWNGSAWSAVAVTQENVPGFSPDVRWFGLDAPDYDGAGMVFFAKLTGPAGEIGSNDDFLWTHGGFGADPVILAREGDEVSTGLRYDVFFGYASGGGQTAFAAQLSPDVGPNFKALFVNGALSQRSGDPAPDDGRAWDGWQQLAMNSAGDLGVTGRVDDGAIRRGIWLRPVGGSYDKVLVEGDTLPGDPDLSMGVNVALQSVISDSGALAFSTPLAGAGVGSTNDGALFWYGDADGAGVQLRMLAREGDQAPFFPPGVIFNDLSPTAAIPNVHIDGEGNVAFRATLGGPGVSSGNNETVWVWLAQRDVLVPLIREGELIEIAPNDQRPLSAFIPGGIDDEQRVVMHATYASGAMSGQGRMVLMVPTAPPLVVNTTGDSVDMLPGDKFCDTGNTIAGGAPECTLRAAIQEANARIGADQIRFDISGGVIPTLEPASPLPALTEEVLIDASTQPEGRVELGGVNAGAATTALTIAAARSEVRAMVINRFGFGVTVVGAGDVRLIDNRIGTDSDGLLDMGNTGHGVLLNDAANALLRDNIVSGNGGAGIEVTGASDGAVLEGNTIGADADGLLPLGNAVGVLIEGGSGHRIGGSDFASRNVVGGNAAEGIRIDGSGSAVTMVQLLNNQLGRGQAADTLANGAAGLYLGNATQVTIGGLVPGDGNLVSGNAGAGIEIAGIAGSPESHQLFGNLVGTDSSGFFPLPNNGDGLLLGAQADANQIGGLTTAHRNLFVGNLGNGLLLRGDDNIVEGNRITTNAIDPGAPANTTGHGVVIDGGARNRIGGSDPGAGNFIQGNSGDGILVVSGTDNRISRNRVFGNAALAINLDEDGMLATRDDATRNDAGDVDSGANDLQNKPTVLKLVGGTDVEGRLSSQANTSYELEFFSNTQVSSPLQAETFLASTTVTTGADGVATFMLSLPQPGDRITMTATDPDGNTSELSVPPLIVNSAADRVDLNPGDESCDTGQTVGADPECTLRAAIQEANALPGLDDVFFGIPGTPPHFIGPGGSGLPFIQDAIALDATTQPGYASRQPVIELVGTSASNSHGFTVISTQPSTLRGFKVSAFDGSGVFFSNADLRLHDMLLVGNDEDGVSGDHFSLIATGLLRAADNNRDEPIPANCGTRAGIKTAGDVSAEDLELVHNCGDGIVAFGGVMTSRTITVSGNTTAVDNAYNGVRGDTILLLGATQQITGNGTFGVSATRDVTLAGMATLSNNGHQLEFPEALRLPCGGDSGPSGVYSRNLVADQLDASNNCGDGVSAVVAGPLGLQVQVQGNARAVGNLGNGIFTFGSIALQGSNNDISDNAEAGLAAQNGSVQLAGATRVANNHTALRAASPQACLGNAPAAVFAGGASATGIGRGDVIADTLSVLDNCGTGVDAVASLNVVGRSDLSRNLGDGARATHIMLAGGGEVARNLRFGLVLKGGSVDIAGVCVCNNGSGGIIGAPAANPPPSTDRTAAPQPFGTGVINAAHLVGNGGDGLRWLGGPLPTLIGINLYGNAGLAVRNFSTQDVVATGNWWGDALGPGGEGPGSGDQIAGMVDASSPLPMPVAGTDSDADGVPDAVEAGAANLGDGNADGMQDAMQAGVISLPAVESGRYLTLAAPVPAFWQSAFAIGNPSPANAPAAGFADGFVSAQLAGIAAGTGVDVAVIEDAADPLAGWYGFGPTPGDTSDHWYVFDDDGSTGLDLGTNPPLLGLLDGARGDSDLGSDGVIRHRGGAVTTTAVSDAGVTHTAIASPGAGSGVVVTYTLAVNNAGPDGADTLVLIDRLPDGYAFVGASGAGWTCQALDQVVTCTRAALATGESVELMLQARAGGEGLIGNTAEITAAPFDPYPLDNVSYAGAPPPSDDIFASGFEDGE